MALKALITAGGDVDAEDADGVTPYDLAEDKKTCRSVLNHHGNILTKVEEKPAVLVTLATAHVATLMPSNDSGFVTSVKLHEYQSDPTFLWAPAQARAEVFLWAQDVALSQLAATNPAFAELPDDCAGDILEYLENTLSREEMLHITNHPLSSEAHHWVKSVIATAVVVSNPLMLFIRRMYAIEVQLRPCLLP
jgi:hypothetical protein